MIKAIRCLPLAPRHPLPIVLSPCRALQQREEGGRGGGGHGEEGCGSTFKPFILQTQVRSVFTKSRLCKRYVKAPPAPPDQPEAVAAERKISATRRTWSDPLLPLLYPTPPLYPLSQISIEVRRADPPNRFAAVSITVWPSVNPQEKMAPLIGFACYRLAPDYCTPCCR